MREEATQFVNLTTCQERWSVVDALGTDPCAWSGMALQFEVLA